jgi:hypothetical protein
MSIRFETLPLRHSQAARFRPGLVVNSRRQCLSTREPRIHPFAFKDRHYPVHLVPALPEVLVAAFAPWFLRARAGFATRHRPPLTLDLDRDVRVCLGPGRQ